MTTKKEALEAKFHFLSTIREFFGQEGFLDVLTPPMVENPGMEPHIHPFQVAHAKTGKLSNNYLHTSPEFHMKELLSLGFENIFTLSYCFRDEPDSPIHRNQFIMLEWYRMNAHYEKIMDDSEKLIQFSLDKLNEKGVQTIASLKNIHFQRVSIQDLFREMLQIDILNYLEKNELKSLIEKDFKDVPMPSNHSNMEWDDYYFLLFLNKIESQLKNFPYILLYDFPHHLSALSTLKENDPRVCERFEIYMNGVELCNCFNELRDISIQKKRFEEQKALKKKLYGYELPSPNVLYTALEKGFPPSAGNALGVERLLNVLTGINQIFWSH